MASVDSTEVLHLHYLAIYQHGPSSSQYMMGSSKRLEMHHLEQVQERLEIIYTPRLR